MNVVAIIQARLTSTRLPGKVLRMFGKHEVLWHVIQRTKQAVPNVVVAIPDTPSNDELWKSPWHEHLLQAIPIYRGPEEDVLARYWGAALMSGADWIVRITADCPLIDPDEIRRVLACAMEDDNYASNDPDLPKGRDVEAFSMVELARAMHHGQTSEDHEHVTPWIKAPNYPIASPVLYGPRQRWTLDTPDDAAWFDRLAQHVNTEPPHPTTQEVLDYIAQTGDVLYEP
jgi:spore coat polysaccharide biosynthesis protein SpsF